MRNRKLRRKTRSINIILTSSITIIALFINFFNGPKLKEYNAQNNTLKNELQALKETNSSLTSENSKLTKNHSEIEKKIIELTKIAK
ncbi:hypothetical protein [Clostridium ganghwense]|uniref:Uncharacterized protein n=1 Tax=Clostridium ganghwense TaxID=312089 RepID=A0ABT4CUI4_9CLOT|nr:hypothetical protein [Clostridium ganghwense]MCY6372745.1 hypothetical protein [Clostridium ganghwense]